MDIYSFIRSQDVAAHCRGLGKKWNTLEMAAIIDRSSRTIAEKHAAWQELIDHYPDMAAMPNRGKIHFESTHKVIAARIDYDRQIMELFLRPENGTFYTYGPHTWGAPFFTTFEKALADLNEKWLERENLDAYFKNQVATELISGWASTGVPYVSFNKAIPDTGGYRIDADSDCGGNLHQIRAWVEDEVRDERFPGTTFNMPNELDFASLFFIDIPTPFKRGDLLRCAGQNAKRHRTLICAGQAAHRTNSNVFVLVGTVADHPGPLAVFLRELIVDGGDMMGEGFFVDANGHLFQDETGPYDSYEYYTDKLEGADRLLHYIRLFITDKIGLAALLNIQHRIIAEESVRTNVNMSDHGCYLSDQLIYEYYGIEMPS